MVILLDKHKRPLSFTTEEHLRKLMEKKRACIYRYFPTVAILMDTDARDFDDLPEYRIKIDPGAKHTGISIIGSDNDKVYMYLQIEHRGDVVKANLDTRRVTRRNRRNRETWYRKPKFGNKAKSNSESFTSSRDEGWLPPSVKSTADNIIHWVEKLCKWLNITSCSFEAVRFDTQLMDNPDIEGEEYQQGTLQGIEIKEYLMDKYGHTCQYCGGASGDPVLEWEHKIPISRGGSDKVSNACLACHTCNQDKGNRTLPEYLGHVKKRAESGEKQSEKQKVTDEARIKLLPKVIENGSSINSNRYCAWANSSRRYIENYLFEKFDGNVECSSGGKTKYNRERLGLPKDHHFDALCVGTVPENGFEDLTGGYCTYIKATGRGNRLLGQVNKCGIIYAKFKDRTKRVDVLEYVAQQTTTQSNTQTKPKTIAVQTGDIVRVNIPNGKYKGTYTGRLMIRHGGSNDLRTLDGKLVTCTRKSTYQILQKKDGYEYSTHKAL